MFKVLSLTILATLPVQCQSIEQDFNPTPSCDVVYCPNADEIILDNSLSGVLVTCVDYCNEYKYYTVKQYFQQSEECFVQVTSAQYLGQCRGDDNVQRGTE